MRQSEKELLWAFIVNEEMRLEDDVQQLRQRLRLRHIDYAYCIELCLALQRLDDFREFALIVIRLLNLSDCT